MLALIILGLSPAMLLEMRFMQGIIWSGRVSASRSLPGNGYIKTSLLKEWWEEQLGEVTSNMKVPD